MHGLEALRLSGLGCTVQMKSSLGRWPLQTSTVLLTSPEHRSTVVIHRRPRCSAHNSGYRNQNALEGVEVNPGSASALELYLSAGGGIVEGITRTADRQPLPNSIVVLASPGTAPSRLTPLQVAVTDQNGVFVMESIPPGRYQLYAWQRLRDHEYFSSDFLSRYETQAIRIDVGDGSRSVIDVTPFPLR